MFPRQDQVADELLVLHAQAGSRRALAVLANRWERRLLLHAMRLTNNPDGAKEVTQESWLAITKGIARLNDPGAFRAWAYSILRRKAADWIRKRRADRKTTTLPSELPAPSADDSHAEIRTALASLNPDDRELITLRHVDGLTVSELATVFRIPTGTVKSRLFAARARLRAAATSEQDTPTQGTRHAEHR